ncbi:hypothetical protein KY343_02180 [Candidatus Woesearchaeota archaeon]|nr:hypothetical protein [Candidatus Woesearchaeota archaeon]
MIEEKVESALHNAKRQVEEVLEGRSVSGCLGYVEGKIRELEPKHKELLEEYTRFISSLGNVSRVEEKQREIKEIEGQLDDLTHISRVINNYIEFADEYQEVRRVINVTRGIDILDKVGLSFLRKKVMSALLSSVYSDLIKVAHFSVNYKRGANLIRERLEDYKESIENYQEDIRVLDEKVEKFKGYIATVMAEFEARREKGEGEYIEDFPDINERYEAFKEGQGKCFEISEERVKTLKILDIEKSKHEELRRSAESRIEELAPMTTLYEAVCDLMGKDPEEEIRKLDSLKTRILMPNEGYSNAA